MKYSKNINGSTRKSVQTAFLISLLSISVNVNAECTIFCDDVNRSADTDKSNVIDLLRNMPFGNDFFEVGGNTGNYCSISEVANEYFMNDVRIEHKNDDELFIMYRQDEVNERKVIEEIQNGEEPYNRFEFTAESGADPKLAFLLRKALSYGVTNIPMKLSADKRCYSDVIQDRFIALCTYDSNYRPNRKDLIDKAVESVSKVENMMAISKRKILGLIPHGCNNYRAFVGAIDET